MIISSKAKVMNGKENIFPTCLYTELAKCYFCVGRYMADKNTRAKCEECGNTDQHYECNQICKKWLREH